LSNRVQAQFETFMAASYPQGVGKQQRIDLRRAFFGGVAILFDELAKVPDHEEAQVCAEIEVEMTQFAVDLASGKA
jgi:hypothetical protein